MGTPIAQELTERVVFWSTTAPMTATGIPTRVAAVYTQWARITETGGTVDELDKTDRGQRQGFEVWVRYNSGITGFMCIVWGTRILQIIDAPTKVIDIRKQQWLRIQTQEATEQAI